MHKNTKAIRQEKRSEALARDVAYKNQSLEDKLRHAGKKETVKLLTKEAAHVKDTK